MNKGNWKVYLGFITLSEAVGALAGWLTRNGVTAYAAGAVKPPLTPPGAVFPIVWAILYLLMGIGMARVWLRGPSPVRDRALILFALQLAVNFLWSLVFFNLRAYAAAVAVLAVLWVLIAGMIRAFLEADTPAALLQLPYLLWVTFAGYLTVGVRLLNA